MPSVPGRGRSIAAIFALSAVVVVTAGSAFGERHPRVQVQVEGELSVLTPGVAASPAVRGERTQVEPTLPGPTVVQDPSCQPARAVPQVARVVVDVRGTGKCGAGATSA